MRFGVIGCGLIGNKRVAAFRNARQEVVLTACADLDREKAEQMAASVSPAARVCPDWQTLIAQSGVDAVIVSTRHDSLAEITSAAIEAGKHVLVEKPAARNFHELTGLADLAAMRNIKVRVGFNHRYHRAFRKARQMFDEGAIGNPMFIRACYGHGGRPGYDREWRADPEISGGGELIDQGVHLIDLSRWFLGEFEAIEGSAQTYYWDMKVDDNAFLLLTTHERRTAFLQVSCTEWKNTFFFELYGTKGKLRIEGLGGSYGTERLYFYEMTPEMGPPPTMIFEYPMADNSWGVEINEFLRDIDENRTPNPGLLDAMNTLKIVDHIYRKSGYDYRT